MEIANYVDKVRDLPEPWGLSHQGKEPRNCGIVKVRKGLKVLRVRPFPSTAKATPARVPKCHMNVTLNPFRGGDSATLLGGCARAHQGIQEFSELVVGRALSPVG